MVIVYKESSLNRCFPNYKFLWKIHHKTLKIIKYVKIFWAMGKTNL